MIQNDFLMFQNFAPTIYRQLSFKIQSIVLSNSRLFISSQLKQLFKTQNLILVISQNLSLIKFENMELILD